MEIPSPPLWHHICSAEFRRLARSSEQVVAPLAITLVIRQDPFGIHVAYDIMRNRLLGPGCLGPM